MTFTNIKDCHTTQRKYKIVQTLVCVLMAAYQNDAIFKSMLYKTIYVITLYEFISINFLMLFYWILYIVYV